VGGVLVGGFLTAAAAGVVLTGFVFLGSSADPRKGQDLTAEVERHRKQLGEARQKAEVDAALIAQLRKTLAESTPAARDDQAAVVQLREKLKNAANELLQAKAALDAANQQLAEARQKANNAEAALEPAGSKKDDKAALETLTKRLAEAERKAADDKTALDAISARLSEAENKAKSAATTAEALRKRLKALGAKAESYKFIDAHALAAPPEVEQSVATLAEYLGAGAIDDKEKARAIFRWIADRIVYDTESFFAGKASETSVEGVLKERKCTCEGYVSMFIGLSNRVGLKAVRVFGYCKSQYGPGTKVTEPKHVWNAVWFEERWWLIDPTLGAGKIRGKSYHKQLTEFCFLTPPEKLIFWNFPKDVKWQLLDSPATFQQFEQWPEVYPGLWDLGVSTDAVRTQLNDNPRGGIVVALDPESPPQKTTMLQGPLERLLVSGKQYTFSFKSDDYVEMMAKQEGQRAFLFTKSGNGFQLTLQAQKGQLFIGGMLPKTTTGFGILEYEVE